MKSLYGSSTPFVTKSSTSTPTYPWSLSTTSDALPCAASAALAPATTPCPAASSYPVVPLIWPAK